MKIETEEKLEKAIKNQPNRYIVYRNTKKELIEVQDKDTGRLWRKFKDGWIWIE